MYGSSIPAPNQMRPTRLPYSKYIGSVTKSKSQRLNETPIMLSLLVPWLIFTLLVSMLSSSMHFYAPFACEAICIIVGVIAGCFALNYLWKFSKSYICLFEDASASDPMWPTFMSTSSCVMILVACIVGNQNFYLNMQASIDVNNLSEYTQIDPTSTAGVELMDAGQVGFIGGTKLQFDLSASFKNGDTYCVTPIGGGANGEYEFWAAGMNCCEDDKFQCGDYKSRTARSGMRVVNEGDRGFYRLAVQRALSTHSIKSTHPIFLHWVEDPEHAKYESKHVAYHYTFLSILVAFVAQFSAVALIVLSQSRLNPCNRV